MKAYLSIKRIFLFTVLLLGSSVGRCQIYKYIGLEDGLSNQKIYHIQKDRRGYMWFLTQEGIDRYDGKRIKHYNFSDDSMKLDSRIALNWLYMDSKDVLWVIGQKGRVFQYDSQHDKFELAYVYIRSWSETSHRHFWITVIWTRMTVFGYAIKTASHGMTSVPEILYICRHRSIVK